MLVLLDVDGVHGGGMFLPLIYSAEGPVASTSSRGAVVRSASNCSIVESAILAHQTAAMFFSGIHVDCAVQIIPEWKVCEEGCQNGEALVFGEARSNRLKGQVWV